MSALAYLENLAQTLAEARGISVREARATVRRALVSTAIQLGVPCERVADYVAAILAAPPDVTVSP